ncbi:hypothetical protein Taro_029117 [Colocasia esculenta]|uniref:Uncharacterized protein n=1 Tax=Colocasia esculenta TaxID=4460 RepID=A0A843VTY0_COLES|nr:hypothetical protein [Colocasia esculenta]
MVSSSSLLLGYALVLLLAMASVECPAITMTIINNRPFSIWPAILANTIYDIMRAVASSFPPSPTTPSQHQATSGPAASIPALTTTMLAKAKMSSIGLASVVPSPPPSHRSPSTMSTTLTRPPHDGDPARGPGCVSCGGLLRPPTPVMPHTR